MRNRLRPIFFKELAETFVVQRALVLQYYRWQRGSLYSFSTCPRINWDSPWECSSTAQNTVPLLVNGASLHNDKTPGKKTECKSLARPTLCLRLAHTGRRQPREVTSSTMENASHKDRQPGPAKCSAQCSRWQDAGSSLRDTSWPRHRQRSPGCWV